MNHITHWIDGKSFAGEAQHHGRTLTGPPACHAALFGSLTSVGDRRRLQY
jgi:hypothetical protein